MVAQRIVVPLVRVQISAAGLKIFGLTCSLEANFPSTEIVMGPIPIRSTKKPTLILTNDCISNNVRNENTVKHSFERYLCNILG